MHITGLVVIGALIVLLVSAALLVLPRAGTRPPDRQTDPTVGFRDPYR